MINFQKNIDKMISKVLNEEIENKVKKITKHLIEEEDKEMEMEEELHGKQSELDVAKPKGKLTKADFKKLHGKKRETKEMFDWSEHLSNDYAENKAEKLSAQEPTYVGRGLSDNKPKMMGSFDDEHGWYDENDRKRDVSVFDDYEEETFDDFDSLYNKYGENQQWFGGRDFSGNFDKKQGRQFFDDYKKHLGDKPFRVRRPRGLGEEAETEEGNAFSGALSKAKKEGRKSFNVGGETYPVREEKKEKKWIQKTGMKKGALHKKLNVPEGEKIPQSKLKSLKDELTKKAEGGKKLSPSDSKLLKQVNLALTLKGLKENKNSLRLTEDELIDMIEKIVTEQKAKENLTKKSPEGLKKTEKVQDQSKKENDDYAKEVVGKMKDYLKDASKGKFDSNPTDFPKSNYALNNMKEKTMKYHPSDAVDEYIEAFAYPGMTNLVFDEIKPDDKKIEMYLKGDSKTGNAEKDKDGKPLGNVVPSEVGGRFMKNYENNLYGAEQMNTSYKRQPQPVDVGGSEKMQGSLKSLKKNSTKKAQKIMNQLESKNDKKQNLMSEEMNKMKKLINYNKKTQ